MSYFSEAIVLRGSASKLKETTQRSFIRHVTLELLLVQDTDILVNKSLVPLFFANY